MKLEELEKGILAGDIRSLAKAITLVEGETYQQRKQTEILLENLLPHSGKAQRLGITGIPGVGKSTFIETMGQRFLRRDFKIAILAIDPSSSLDKGSILGDKTRMEKLSRSPQVFIRPSPAGNHTGGVAAKTRESILLCEAAGFDFIIVETVGVGQSETMVHSMVDTFLLLQVPGTGDDLQGIKRGVLELVDIIAITKAEKENMLGAKKSQFQLNNALSLVRPHQKPKIHLISSFNQNGFQELEIDVLQFWTDRKKELAAKRYQQQLTWFDQKVATLMQNYLHTQPQIRKLTHFYRQKIKEHKITANKAARELLSQIFHQSE